VLTFLLLFFTIYGGMQAVVFLKIHPLLPQARLARPALGLFMGLMVLSPVLTHLLDSWGRSAGAKVFGWAGYSWMGFTFLAFWMSLLLFLAEALLWLLRRSGMAPLPSLPPKPAAWAVLLLTAGLCLYGHLQTHRLATERVRLLSPKLETLSSLRIVQISDLHLGLLSSRQQLASIIERIRKLEPDLLVCTGDLVDGDLQRLAQWAPMWQELDPPLGKFAVTGNHEYYAGLEDALELLRGFGFRVLMNESARIHEEIALFGTEDALHGDCALEERLLSRSEPGRYQIYLKHRPLVCAQPVDLQLSGHTHKGQIFPFNLFVGLHYPFISGLHRLDNGSSLYVSRGTGTWGPRIRLGSSPEITVIEVSFASGKSDFMGL
jgi:hypothetical protein